jgi:hypothetical protein
MFILMDNAGRAGTIGENQTAISDSGTGYNYYDGSAWGMTPSLRFESVRAGWHSYAPGGPNGVIVIFSPDGTFAISSFEAWKTKALASWTTGHFSSNRVARVGFVAMDDYHKERSL